MADYEVKTYGSGKIYLEEKSSCNLIVLDLIFMVGFVILMLPTSIHIVFRIIIALVAFGVYSFLLGIKIIGTILHILAGVFWASGLYSLLNAIFKGYFTRLSESNKVSWIIWIVAMGLICVAIHIGSAKKMGIEDNTVTEGNDCGLEPVITSNVTNQAPIKSNVLTNDNAGLDSAIKRYDDAWESFFKIHELALPFLKKDTSSNFPYLDLEYSEFKEAYKKWEESSDKVNIFVEEIKSATDYTFKLTQLIYFNDYIDELIACTRIIQGYIVKHKKSF